MKGTMIIGLVAGEYTLYDFEKGKRIRAKARGKFRQKELYSSPKVGDMVEYDDTNPDSIIITSVAERTSDLVRPPIANINQALLVFSVKKPDFNDHLLDRFLCIIEYNNIKPIIIFSKWDLLNEEEKEQLEPIVDYYQNIGYQVFKFSKYEPLSPEILALIDDHISVVTGQSGVGKSSLLNMIDNSWQLKTDEISEALGRGKHTTREVQLMQAGKGWIADTPGFGTLEFENMNEIDISHSFVEFFGLSHNCKFKGCLHQKEPACAVKRALEEKKILATRYENYLSFIEEIKEKSKRKW